MFGHLESNLPTASEGSPHQPRVSRRGSGEGLETFRVALKLLGMFPAPPQVMPGESQLVMGVLGGSQHVPSWVAKHQLRATGVVSQERALLLLSSSKYCKLQNIKCSVGKIV